MPMEHGGNNPAFDSAAIDDTNLIITEDGGDLVAKDDVGNVVLRYDDDTGSWVMDSLKTEDATITHTVSAPPIQPEFTQDFGGPAVGHGWEVEPAAMPLSVVDDPFIDVSANPDGGLESVAHRSSNDYYYVSEDTGSNNIPANIYEYDETGAETGAVMELPSNVQHVYRLDWDREVLWAADYQGSSGDLYRIDFDNQTVLQTIAVNGAVADYEWIATIPATDGEKLLFADISGDTAFLVDKLGTVEDGETDGNVGVQLRNPDATFFNGGAWVNGRLFWNTHGVLGVSRVGVADRIGERFPLPYGADVGWVYQPDGTGSLEGIGYDEHDGSLLVVDSGDGTVKRYKEQFPGSPYGSYTQDQVEDTGFGQRRVLSLSGSDSGAAIQIADEYRSGRLEIRFYDDGSDSKQMYAAAGTTGPSGKHTLGVNTAEVGTTNFARWNTDDGWEDTGVARPSTPQWVVFAWVSTGEEVRLKISKDYGETWEDAGTKTNQANSFNLIRIEANSGTAKYGTVRVLPSFQ